MLNPKSKSIYDGLTGRDVNQESLPAAKIVRCEDLIRERQLQTRERPLNADFISAVQDKGVVLYVNGHAVGTTNCVETTAEYLLTYDMRHTQLSHS